MSSQQKVFANGMIFKEPSAQAPDYVLGNISINTGEFITFLQQRNKTWVNLNVKRSQGGKPYVELDTWEPTGAASQPTRYAKPVDNEEDMDDCPF